MKGAKGFVDMDFTEGDRLKLTGISGIYSTVIAYIPTSSKDIAFNFIACTDGDNNNYPVLKIGTQAWTAENLKTTKYNDKTEISNVSDPSAWSSLTSPAYCWYNNDPANKIIYGVLYNWYTFSKGHLCPTGWPLLSSSEWTALITFLGSETVAGGHLKETGITQWTAPNPSADNSSCCTALPSGVRYDTYLPVFNMSVFDFLNTSAWFTASDEASSSSAYWLSLYSTNSGSVLRNSFSKNTGFSVHCLKDQ